jgi:N-acyl-D-aspartate/D-glutamate deacylase
MHELLGGDGRGPAERRPRDPRSATVADRATYQQPGLPAVGFRYVPVSGALVVADGQVKEGVLPRRAARAAIR